MKQLQQLKNSDMVLKTPAYSDKKTYVEYCYTWLYAEKGHLD